MGNKYDLVGIFLIIVNIIMATAMILYLDYRLELFAGETGPMGDTFGGFLSPVIGGISLFYVYKTYKEQRSASAYTDHTKVLDDIIDDLKEIKYNRDKDFEVNGEKIKKFTGYEALSNFLVMKREDHDNIYYTLRNEDKEFLEPVLNIVTRLANATRIIEGQRQILATDHRNALNDRLLLILNFYGAQIMKIFSNIQFELSIAPDSASQVTAVPLVPAIKIIDNINYLAIRYRLNAFK